MNKQVIFLSETWRKDKDRIILDGYVTFQNDRKIANKRSRKGYGGVCFLVKDELFKSHVVDRVDDNVEGIIALLFTNKHTKHTTLIIGVYLAPETSIYGDDPDTFF